MKTFDRVVLVVLALGIWALVLKPSDITAHGEWHTHSADCTISGSAEGSIRGRTVDVDSWYYTTVECSVD